MKKDFVAAELSLGQINALVKKLGGVKLVKGILDGSIEFMIGHEGRILNVFLQYMCQVTIPAMNGFDPQNFFTTKEGLNVQEDFKKLVLELAAPISTPISVLEKSKLKQHATDIQITNEMLDQRIFTNPSELCAWIACLINQQQKGISSELCEEKSNIFYLKVDDKITVVFLMWTEEYLGHPAHWSVNAYKLGGSNYWSDGYQVFGVDSD